MPGAALRHKCSASAFFQNFELCNLRCCQWSEGCQAKSFCPECAGLCKLELHIAWLFWLSVCMERCVMFLAIVFSPNQRLLGDVAEILCGKGGAMHTNTHSVVSAFSFKALCQVPSASVREPSAVWCALFCHVHLGQNMLASAGGSPRCRYS